MTAATKPGNHTNRIAALTGSTEPHPGTADDAVNESRLVGRMAFRNARVAGRDMDEAEQEFNKKRPPEWWLGWYDERLRRFFGR